MAIPKKRPPGFAETVLNNGQWKRLLVGAVLSLGAVMLLKTCLDASKRSHLDSNLVEAEQLAILVSGRNINNRVYIWAEFVQKSIGM